MKIVRLKRLQMLSELRRGTLRSSAYRLTSRPRWENCGEGKCVTAQLPGR